MKSKWVQREFSLDELNHNKTAVADWLNKLEEKYLVGHMACLPSWPKDGRVVLVKVTKK